MSSGCKCRSPPIWILEATTRRGKITTSFIVVKIERSTSQQSVKQDNCYIANAYTVTQDSHNNQI